ncbi:MAG TPA: hypothetical protein VGQ83_19365 [Polyangia bacterium]|jgi:hypothetical protein
MPVVQSPRLPVVLLLALCAPACSGAIGAHAGDGGPGGDGPPHGQRRHDRRRLR